MKNLSTLRGPAQGLPLDLFESNTMNVAARIKARVILGEKETRYGMAVDRIYHILGRLRDPSELELLSYSG